MARLFLIRHAESIANTKGIYQGQTYDTGLSPLGKKQAEALAKRLASKKLNKIIVSPLKRTRETAEEIIKMQGDPLRMQGVSLQKEIIETDHGAWEGLYKRKIEKNYPDLYKLWQNEPMNIIFPKGEAFIETIKRVIKWWFTFKKNLKTGDRIALVSHDNILRIILCHLQNISYNRMWEIKLKPASVSEIECSEIRILSLSDDNHLKNLPDNINKHAL